MAFQNTLSLVLLLVIAATAEPLNRSSFVKDVADSFTFRRLPKLHENSEDGVAYSQFSRKLLGSRKLQHRFVHRDPVTGVHLAGIKYKAQLADNHSPLAFNESVVHTECIEDALIFVFQFPVSGLNGMTLTNTSSLLETLRVIFGYNVHDGSSKLLLSGICNNKNATDVEKPFYRAIHVNQTNLLQPTHFHSFQRVVAGQHKSFIAFEVPTVDVTPRELFDSLNLSVRWRPPSEERVSGHTMDTEVSARGDGQQHLFPRDLLDLAMLTDLGGFAPECETRKRRRRLAAQSEHHARNLAFWDDVGNAWDSLREEIETSVEDAIDAVTDTIDDAVDQVEDVVEEITDKVDGAISDATSRVTEFVSSAPEKVKEYWSGVYEEVKDKFDEHVLEPLSGGKTGITCKLSPNVNINYNRSTLSAIEPILQFSDPSIPSNVKEWVTCRDCYLYAGVETHLDIEFGSFGVPERFEAGVFAESRGNLKIHVDGPRKELLKYFDASGPKKLATFQFSIGPVVVWINLLVGLHGAIASNLNPSGTVTFDAGIQFHGSYSAKAFWTGESGWHSETREVLESDYWLPDWNLISGPSGQLEGTVGPEIILEIWDTVPVVFKPKPKVHTTFGSATLASTKLEVGHSTGSENVCDKGDEYSLDWEMSIGIGIADVVIPDSIPVIGGKTLVGGHDFGEAQLIQREGFPECGKLCSGCYSDYVQNQEQLVHKAVVNSMDRKHLLALDALHRQTLHPVLIVFIVLLVLLSASWIVLASMSYVRPGVLSRIEQRVPCVEGFLACTPCKQCTTRGKRGFFWLKASVQNSHVRERDFRPLVDNKQQQAVPNTWNKYYQHNQASPTERKIGKLSPSALRPYSGGV